MCHAFAQGSVKISATNHPSIPSAPSAQQSQAGVPAAGGSTPGRPNPRMNAPSRKFSTVLPSVASLRSKFEKPGAQNSTPPLMRVPSASGGLLKTASSQTALLKTNGSVSQGLKSATSYSTITLQPGAVPPTDGNNDITSAIPPPLVIKTQLEPLEEGANEAKTPTTPLVAVPERRASSVAEPRRSSVAPAETARKPSLAPSDAQRRASQSAEAPPPAAVVEPRRQSVTPVPPPVAPPKPPQSVSPQAPLEKVGSEPTPNAIGELVAAPVLKNEGILFSVEGYGRSLDAMRGLRREVQARLGREGFLDPTTCRSVGMQSFLDNSEAVFAFLEGATVSSTVRYQLARAFFLGKKVALFSEDDFQAVHTVELIAQLVGQLAASPEESLGKSKDEWQRLLNGALVRFVAAPHSEERRALTLAPIERILTGSATVFGSPSVLIPDPPPNPCAFMIMGFGADNMARLEIELTTRGYPTYVSDSAVVKAVVGLFCLPSRFDQMREEYRDRRMMLETCLRESRGRGMTVLGVAAADRGGWVPPELDGLVFPHDAAPEDIIRACDVPPLALKLQGDALEPMRVVAEKARRFSAESGRDAVRLELLQGKQDKITILSAPAGWGKTTLLAEVCRRHNRVVSTLSVSVLDQSESVGAVYFFNRLDPSRSNFAANCFRSISRQLSGAVPGFVLDESAQDILDDPSSSITSLLECLIVQPAVALVSKGKPPSRRVLIVVDALDECEDYEQLQTALNAKWQSVPNWLALVCSMQTRPQIVAKHFEITDNKHLGKYLEHLLGTLWLVPDARDTAARLEARAQNSFLWATICEPILVNACETAALAQAAAYAPYIEANLPSQPGIERAVKFVFDRYAESETDAERVRQAYALAICAPRSFVPVEIYSYCGVDKVPPLMVIEDLCVKPLHPKVLDALLSECGVKLEAVRDHGLISDALEKAYASGDLTTPIARRFAAAHASMHARLAERTSVAKAWFEDFARLFDAVAQCVRETGDAQRTAQDGEDCGVSDEIVDVVRLASSAVAFDVREFPGQVIGRLGGAHPLAIRAREYTMDVLVQNLRTMVALPNPHFSGLNPARGPLRKVLRHRGPVLAAVESNGFALTCSGPIGFIWNVARSEKLAVLKGHTEDIRCCTFGCAKQAGDVWAFMALTGSGDHTARLWQGSFRTSQPSVVLTCVRTFTGHDAVVTCLAYKGGPDPLRTVLCSGSADKTIIVWDSTTGQQRARLTGHSGEVRCLCLTEESILISGSQDKTCRLWDIAAGKEIARLEGHSRDVSAVACSKDRFYTASFDGVARAFDAKSRKQLIEYKGHTQRINAMSVSPDGTRLATASYDGTARVFETASGALLLVLKGHANDVASVRFCSDPIRLVTASLDCEVRFWSAAPDIVERFRALASRHHDEQVTCVSLCEKFACSGSADGSARVWSLATGALLAELKEKDREDSLSGVVVANDGSVVVTAAEDGQITIWDVASPTKPRSVIADAHKDVIEELSISDDGRHARTVSYDKEMFIWDLSTGSSLRAGSVVPRFTTQPSSRKQESRHVLGPTGASVGFTLDATNFSVALAADDDSILPRTFGELGDLFYLWEWLSPPA